VAVVTVIDWINAAHRFLVGLFFDWMMRDKVGRARDQR
jgi:hypothetical protein